MKIISLLIIILIFGITIGSATLIVGYSINSPTSNIKVIERWLQMHNARNADASSSSTLMANSSVWQKTTKSAWKNSPTPTIDDASWAE